MRKLREFIPEWMSDAQAIAVEDLYKRDADGASDLGEFFKRVKYHIGGFCGLGWCGMFVGIEPDGYTHT